MSLNNLLNDDQNNALNIWIDHIAARNSSATKYSGTSINGFKTGKKTKPAADIIIEYIDSLNILLNFELDQTNMDLVLFTLFSKSNPEDYSSQTYKFLHTILKTKRVISQKTTETQLNILREKFKEAQNIFEELEIQDPFITSQKKTTLATTSSGLTSETNKSSVLIDNEINNRATTSGNDGSNDNESENESDDEDEEDEEDEFFESSGATHLIYSLFNELKVSLDEKFEDLKTQLKPNQQLNDKYQDKSYKELTNILAFRTKKLILTKNAIAIQRSHLSNKTAPKALQASQFFTPYMFTTNFLRGFDNILLNTQASIMNLIIDELNKKRTCIESDIDQICNKIENHLTTSDNIQEIKDKHYKEQEKKLTKRFNASINKTNKDNETCLLIYEDKINDNFINDQDSITSTNNTKSHISTENNKNNKVNRNNKSMQSKTQQHSINNYNRSKFMNNGTKNTYQKNIENNNKIIIDGKFSNYNNNQINHRQAYNNNFQSTKQNNNYRQPNNNAYNKQFNQNNMNYSKPNNFSYKNQKYNGYNNYESKENDHNDYNYINNHNINSNSNSNSSNYYSNRNQQNRNKTVNFHQSSRQQTHQ